MSCIVFLRSVLQKGCVPAVTSQLSLKAEVSLVGRAAKSVKAHPPEDESFPPSASLVGGSAGVGWSWRQHGSGLPVSGHTQRHLPGKPKSAAAAVNPAVSPPSLSVLG